MSTPPKPQLSKPTTGPLAGFTVAPIDIALMLSLTAQCMVARVRYRMGGKAKDIHAVPLDTDAIDCSGFVRWLLYHITGGALLLPDGSWNEDHAIALAGFKSTDPENCGLKDGHVRLCVHIADDKDGTGHIWLCFMGWTLESHGGRGVNRRPWNWKLSCGYRLNELATHCFVLC